MINGSDIGAFYKSVFKPPFADITPGADYIGIDFHIDGFASRAVICAITGTAGVTGFTVNFPMFKSVRHRRLLAGCNAVLATGARLKTAALVIVWQQAIYGDRQFVTALQPWQPSGDGPYANDRGEKGVEGDHDTG